MHLCAVWDSDMLCMLLPGFFSFPCTSMVLQPDLNIPIQLPAKLKILISYGAA